MKLIIDENPDSPRYGIMFDRMLRMSEVDNYIDWCVEIMDTEPFAFPVIDGCDVFLFETPEYATMFFMRWR